MLILIIVSLLEDLPSLVCSMYSSVSTTRALRLVKTQSGFFSVTWIHSHGSEGQGEYDPVDNNYSGPFTAGRLFDSDTTAKELEMKSMVAGQ